MANVAHAVVGTTTSTSSTAAQTLITGQGSKVFAHAVLYNPSGSGAGQWSDDNFKNNIYPFAAGPSFTRMFDCGSIPNGIQVRRTTATDVSGAIVGIF